MTSDLDIIRAANVLVKQHGENAPTHAATNADALLDKGDVDGHAVWRRIVKAAEEILSTERPPEVPLQ